MRTFAARKRTSIHSIYYLTCRSYSKFIHCAPNSLTSAKHKFPQIRNPHCIQLSRLLSLFSLETVSLLFWLSWAWPLQHTGQLCCRMSLSWGLSDTVLWCRPRLCVLGAVLLSAVTRSHVILTQPVLGAVNFGHWTKVFSPRFPHGKLTICPC